MANRGRRAKRLPLDTVAGRMGAAADAAGLSSEEIADRLDSELPGITSAAVRKWLRGEREPRLDALRAYARVVGTSAGWLVDGGRSPSEDLAAFKLLVLQGLPPSEAWCEATQSQDALTVEESERLDAAVSELRSAFASGELEQWALLTEREQAVVGSLIALLAERKGDDG